MKWALLPFVNEETVSENKASTATYSTHLLGTYCVLGDKDSAWAVIHVLGLLKHLVWLRATDIKHIILQFIKYI